METVQDVQAWLSEYSFQDWELSCREPHLPRNKGCGTVLRMMTHTLENSGRPDHPATFDMEVPLSLPTTSKIAEQLLWTLIQFTAIHEAAEWFKQGKLPVFDPHTPSLESVIYKQPQIVWSESDA